MINEAQLFLEIDNATFQKDLKQDWYEIDEAGMSRIVGSYRDFGFIIVSSQRTFEADNGRKPTPEEQVTQVRINRKNDEEIKKVIKGEHGYGFVPVYGGYREKGVDSPTPELSYIIPSKKVQQNSSTHKDGRQIVTNLDNSQYSQAIKKENDRLIKLGKIICGKYNQDSFLFKPSDLIDKNAYWLDRNGKKLETFDESWSINDLSKEYFTQLRRKSQNRFTLNQKQLYEAFYYIRNSPPGMDMALRRYGEHFFNKEWVLGIKK